jgi:hypothetical protein
VTGCPLDQFNLCGFLQNRPDKNCPSNASHMQDKLFPNRVTAACSVTFASLQTLSHHTMYRRALATTTSQVKLTTPAMLLNLQMESRQGNRLLSRTGT